MVLRETGQFSFKLRLLVKTINCLEITHYVFLSSSLYNLNVCNHVIMLDLCAYITWMSLLDDVIPRPSALFPHVGQARL